MEVGVVIVAAGEGTRMGSRVRKPLLKIGHMPIIVRTVAQFLSVPEIAEHVLVVHREDEQRVREILKGYGMEHIVLTSGGGTRQESVMAGIARLSPRVQYVLVHDGVRPFASTRLIASVIRAVYEKGAVVPAIPVKDTIKVVRNSGEVAHTPDRQSLWAVQTPQAFRMSLLKEALHEARKEGFVGTDEAMLLEKKGCPVYIVEGEYTNIKVTTPEDLLIAEAILKLLEGQHEDWSRV